MPRFPDTRSGPFESCSSEAVFRAIMQYPKRGDAEKRLRLAMWYSTRQMVHEAGDDCPSRDFYSLYDVEKLDVARCIRQVDKARTVQELGDDPAMIHRKGFLAAHWLRYRLYAAAHDRRLGTTDKWQIYVSAHLLPELKKDWPTHYNSFQRDRREFAPVAHLWLSYFEHRDDDGYMNYTPRLRPVSLERLNRFEHENDDDRRARAASLLSRAKAYFELGQAAGLYGGRSGQISLDDAWLVPDTVQADDLAAPLSPDLAVKEFDADEFLRDYVPRHKREPEDDGEHYRPAMAKQKA